MKIYFAPMEGVTGYVYRSAHHAFFKDIDKYFSPFIVPTQSKRFAPRELRDVLPEYNEGIPLIPQLLTNHADGFIWAAGELKALGYEEINLNLGCPSKTVVSKNRGSGFLALREELDRFFDAVFRGTDVRISVKTRIGKEDPGEFCELIEIFNRYPLEELIIHPRVQTDFYRNVPNLDVYADAVRLSKNPLCYNGDIFNRTDYDLFMTRFPDTACMMLGRGLIANPALAEEMKGGIPMEKERFLAFHDRLLHDYMEIMSGDRNVLFKMKELWVYMGGMFENPDKLTKRIRKTERLCDYNTAVSELFDSCALKAGGYHI